MKPRSVEETEILRKATKVFADVGYKDTKMSDIAKELGISRKPLYYSFENKEGLFRQVVKLYYTHYMNRMKSILQGEGSIFDKMYQLQLADDSYFYDEKREYYDGSKIMQDAQRYFKKDETVSSFIKEFRDSYTAQYREAIQEAIWNGELKKDTNPDEIVGISALFFYGNTSELGAIVHQKKGKEMTRLAKVFIDTLKATYGV